MVIVVLNTPRPVIFNLFSIFDKVTRAGIIFHQIKINFFHNNWHGVSLIFKTIWIASVTSARHFNLARVCCIAPCTYLVGCQPRSQDLSLSNVAQTTFQITCSALRANQEAVKIESSHMSIPSPQMYGPWMERTTWSTRTSHTYKKTKNKFPLFWPDFVVTFRKLRDMGLSWKLEGFSSWLTFKHLSQPPVRKTLSLKGWNFTAKTFLPWPTPGAKMSSALEFNNKYKVMKKMTV